MKELVHSFAIVLAVGATGCPGIYGSAEKGDARTLKELLRGQEDRVNAVGNGEQHIPLCTAVIAEQPATVRVLLEMKSITNTDCHMDGATLSPLEIAVRKRNARIAEMLLDAGASPTFAAYTENGSFLLSLLYDKPSNVHELIDDYLKRIAQKRGKETVAKLVGDGDHRWNVLAYAAYHGDHRTVRVLLDHGASPNWLEKGEGVDKPDRWPVLFWARAGGNQETVKLLLQRGARSDVKTEGGTDYETAVAKVRAQQAADAERMRREEAEWKAMQREVEAEARRDEAEAARNQAAQNQAMWNRLNGTTPSSNPLDDNSFQDRMRAQAQGRSPSGNQPGGSTTNPTTASAPAPDRNDDTAAKREEAKKKAEQEKAQREELAKQERARFLDTMRGGIRLAATKCPGGEGKYHVIGTKPKANLDLCINVSYRATCSSNQGPSTGVLRNFSGGGSCFGDTQVISPTPSCKPEEVTVHVDDVQLCSP